MPESALARCVADPEAFLREDWGRRAHHAPRVDPDGFADLLSLDAIDELITASGLRAPAFRLVRDGATLPAARSQRSARIGSRPVTDLADPGRVLAEFAAGATVVLQGLQRSWAPLAAFCRDLELRLGHPVQANAYLTPPSAAGLRVHADAHDVFALQTFGRKHWVVYEDEGDEPTADLVLEPGDALYLPAGTRHAARTLDTPSAHVTIGVPARTWADLLRPALLATLDAPAFTERLPVGEGQRAEALVSGVAERLAQLRRRVEALDAGPLAERAAWDFASARAPRLRGALRDLVALDVDGLDDRTPVWRRPGTACATRLVGGSIEVALGDRTLVLPAHAGPALDAVAGLRDGQRLRPCDLPGLDEAGRVVLVRRLVREGLLTLQPSGAGGAADASGGR